MDQDPSLTIEQLNNHRYVGALKCCHTSWILPRVRGVSQEEDSPSSSSPVVYQVVPPSKLVSSCASSTTSWASSWILTPDVEDDMVSIRKLSVPASSLLSHDLSLSLLKLLGDNLFPLNSLLPCDTKAAA